MSQGIITKYTGQRMVFGVPEKTKPIHGLPEGKAKIRLRNDDVGRAFVRGVDGIRHFILLDQGDYWGLVEQGRNEVVR